MKKPASHREQRRRRREQREEHGKEQRMLPNELWVIVMSYLDPESLLSFSSTCRFFRSFLRTHFMNKQKTLHIEYNQLCDDIHNLTHLFPGIKYLTVFTHKARKRKAPTLIFKDGGFDSLGFQQLLQQHMPQLETIALTVNCTNWSSVESVKWLLNRLESVDIIDDEASKVILPHATQIKSLTLTDCMTDLQIASPHLKELELNLCFPDVPVRNCLLQFNLGLVTKLWLALDYSDQALLHIIARELPLLEEFILSIESDPDEIIPMHISPNWPGLRYLDLNEAAYLLCSIISSPCPPKN